MKMRQDIVNLVNKLCMTSDSLDIDVVLMYKLIFDYCKNNKISLLKIKVELINGVLFIEEKAIERVAPLPPKAVFDERSYYIEGKILARQEYY